MKHSEERDATLRSSSHDVKRLYKKFSLAITIPMVGNLLDSGPSSPPLETRLRLSLDAVTASAQPHTPDEEDIDTARPVGEVEPLNCLVNVLSTVQVYSGIGGAQRKVHSDIPRTNSSKQLNGDVPRIPDQIPEDEVKEDRRKEEFTAEELAEVAKQQELLNNAQRAHEMKGSLTEEDESKMAKILSSLADSDDQHDLDQLYKAELEKDQDSHLIQSARRSSIINAGGSINSSSTLGGSLGGATEGGISSISTQSSFGVARTPFQKSVVANLEPHFLTDSLLLKLKEDDTSKSKLFVSGSKPMPDTQRKNLSLQIADKLTNVFELEDDDIFYGNYSAWLVRDVLLQGHLYLTKRNILFFAFLPDRYKHDRIEDESIQSGSIGMKSSKIVDTVTVLTHRFWGVLRPDTLSIYSSTTDLYFPSLVIDLDTCIRAEVVDKMGSYGSSSKLSDSNSVPNGSQSENQLLKSNTSSPTLSELDMDVDNNELLAMNSSEIDEINESVGGGIWFKLVTKKKTYRFYTDNLYSARQWVNNLTKIIFEKNNSNAKNEVLCKIPIDQVIDFRRQSLFDTTAAEDVATPTPSHLSLSTNGNTLTEEVPNSLTLSYFLAKLVEDKLLLTEKMKKKLKGKSRTENDLPPGVDMISFMFFKDSDLFMNKLKEVLLENRKPEAKPTRDPTLSEKMKEKAKKMTRKDSVGSASSLRMSSTPPAPTVKTNLNPVSTLQPSDNTLLSYLNYSDKLKELTLRSQPNNQDPQLDPNCIMEGYRHSRNLLCQLLRSSLSPTRSTQTSSKLKKLSKSLTNPVKILSGNSSNGSRHRAETLPLGPINPSSFLERANSEDHINHLAVSPSGRLALPRHISMTDFKNMNMSLEASKRDIHVAESRYAGNGTESPKRFVSKPNFDFGDDEIDKNETDENELKLKAPEGSNKNLSMQALDEKSVPLQSPLNLTDPVDLELDQKTKRTPSSKLKKGFKVIGNAYHMWSAHPYHYTEGIENDQYYVSKVEERENTKSNFINYFKLKKTSVLISSYYCHLKRSIPVYGSLYLGDQYLCFRSLLPGVSTQMILPIQDIEECQRAKGISINYSGLEIVIKRFDKLYLEFSSQKSRDDCELMLSRQIELVQRANHIMNNRRGSLSLEDSNNSPHLHLDKSAHSRVENARIKLFEDRINSALGLDVPILLEDSPFFKTEIRPTSFHFTLLTIGSRGDVQPYIALAKGLKAEGHRVTIATHVEFKDWISKHKIGFKPIAGDPTELMSLMVEHGSMSVSFIKEASSKFRGWIQELLTTSWEACQGTDILIESPSAMGGIHIAEALGIPYFRAFTMPWTRTRAYPHAFIVPDQKRSGSYNYLTHVMFETVFWKGISSQVNRWRVEELGIPRTNLYKMQQTKIPFLYNISPSVFPPSVDFPDWIKVTGYWFLEEGLEKDYNPPADLVKFMEKAKNDNKKIVYIGFGSIVVSDAKVLTKAIVDAVLNADVRCILNKGWSDRKSKSETSDEPEVELPAEVFNSGNIPHDWLFDRIDAAVHHGGAGTTGATLKAGLPTIIKPFFGDQYFYASRVEEVGLGLSLKKLNAKSLTKCLKTVTRDEKMMERARKISIQIRNENGLLNAIECIYSELEYARNLLISKHLDYNKEHILSSNQTPMREEEANENGISSQLEGKKPSQDEDNTLVEFSKLELRLGSADEDFDVDEVERFKLEDKADDDDDEEDAGKVIQMNYTNIK